MALWPNGSSERPTITSGFGPREASGGASSYHRGVDFIGFRVIKAVEDGVVRCSGSAPSGWSAGGDQVWIQHDGFFSKSLHQARSLVSDGQWVRAGDDVAIMGESGSAQGVHQHFEITPGELHFANSGQVDPVAFLSSRISGGGSNSQYNKDVEIRQGWLISRGYDLGPSGADGIAGPMYDAAVKKYQTFLRAYGYTGGIDGAWGEGTQEAHQKYWDQVNNPTPANEELKRQQDWLISRGYDLGPSGADGIWGAKTEAAFKAYQQFLRAYGYTGDIDGVWGGGTQEAHAKYYDELRTIPSGTPTFPLAPNQYFGPEGGGDNSISGYYSHSEDLKRWQQRMADRGWPITVDGLYGVKGATTPAGNTAEVTVAFQKEKGLDADGLIGPATWKAAWEEVVTPAPPTPANPNPTEPTPTPTPEPSGELKYTPDLITPDASDFPSWIKFDIALDPDGQQVDNNKSAYEYYDELYNPVESHIHWWGEPGKAGTHDGNVNYIRNTKDLSVNFVLSAGRITLMVPIDQIALTTGKRNPFAWKVENDPMLTTLANDELGYKTLGYLHYIVGKLNPSLAGAPVRLHKEFMSTTCSGLDKEKVRYYAEAFRTGALDPATGFPPKVNPGPEPTPDPAPISTVLVDRSFLKGLANEFRDLATDFDTLAE